MFRQEIIFMNACMPSLLMCLLAQEVLQPLILSSRCHRLHKGTAADIQRGLCRGAGPILWLLLTPWGLCVRAEELGVDDSFRFTWSG